MSRGRQQAGATVEFRLDIPPTAEIAAATRPQRAVRARRLYPPPVPVSATARTSLSMPALRLA